jgi:hypothetical protein
MAAWGLGALILIDSNILIDILDKDPAWFSWSRDQLCSRIDEGMAVNQIIVAELAPRFASLAHFQSEMEPLHIEFEEFGADAAFETGDAFVRYKKNRRDGAPRLPLPDFFIGGHAQTLGATILTRDPRFYRAYFPEVPLITPTKDDE